MTALIIYESMFGNTRAIAEAIAVGIETRMKVDLVEVGVAPSTPPEEVDLLVLGGPTHAFSMSHPSTREDAADESPIDIVSRDIGIREWLAAAQKATGDRRAATFDTRINSPRIPGSAAVAAKKRLRRLGYRLLGAESFYVDATTGPLIKGELRRAGRWGEFLAAVVAPQEAHESRTA